MRIIILAAVAGSLFATGAWAAQTTGTIASINKKSDTITLSGGKRFHLPEGIEVESLGVGEHVKISYTLGAGHRREVSAVHTLR